MPRVPTDPPAREWSIDHIAVRTSWRVHEAAHVPAVVDGRRLFDHDLYVVEAQVR